MWVCPNGHEPNEFIVFIGEELDPDGIGILVNPDGSVTNRWGDGTAGIGQERSELAADQEEAYCTECIGPSWGTRARWVK